jgi:DNA-binding IclR family transcriptional regulator
MNGSNHSRNPNYLVPCVFKAVRMIEALREAQGRLRVEDFRSTTGYARTTIYRILRTLVACEYLIRDSGGYYRLNHAVVATADAATRNTQDSSEFAPSLQANDRNVGFERWGIQFRGNGTRMNTHSQTTQLAVSQAGDL